MTDATIGGSASKVSSRWFYAWMAATCLAIAVIGFMPTYFAPMVQGSFVGPTLLHIHGLIFFSWTALFCVQTWLVASGGVLAHRTWGMLGIAIATAMIFSVLVTVAVRANEGEALGIAQQARTFAWVQVGGMLFFAAVFTLAIVNLKKADVHKRLMLLGTISLLDAPIARWFITFFAPPAEPGAPPAVPPVFVTIPPALVADLLLVAAIVYDWRTRGKPHPVYLIGGAALLVFQLTRPLIAETEAWQAVALWIQHLGG
jgi:hypothetical protein